MQCVSLNKASKLTGMGKELMKHYMINCPNFPGWSEKPLNPANRDDPQRMRYFIDMDLLPGWIEKHRDEVNELMRNGRRQNRPRCTGEFG